MKQCGSSLWLVITPPVFAVPACTKDSQAANGCRYYPAALSPEPSYGAGTAPRSQEEFGVVKELLRNSLDKAYGKEGNPFSPGLAAPLP